MNDVLATRLLDVLRETNRNLERIADQLTTRQPYKPLLIHINGNIQPEEFEMLKTYLDEYFKEIEGQTT